MKPLLERKRRARINRCLDELKELMSSALTAEGENLTKLEKADVLELTVRHLHKLRERQQLNGSTSPAAQQDPFRAGFTHCAAEVSRYMAASTGLDVQVGQRLLAHLGRCVHQLDTSAQPSSSYTPPSSPTTPVGGYRVGGIVSPASSPALSDLSVSDMTGSSFSVSSSVWRPW